ncbi:MFS transporter [Brevundimonas sp.]|uniref:MFS transporter n=1 Tax=Brevundimonas sp. TaxID=1871086 RepID=UPI0037C0EFD1
MPWPGLLALAMAGFICILTEALPAGLLLEIGASLSVSESLVGQLVTVYAAGAVLAAIPLTAATQHLPRRQVLLASIAVFAVANTVTALSSAYGLTLAFRFFAGVAAGLLWSLLAGYAARMVPEAMRGRAIAVAMVGTPLALSLGIPAGTFVGGAIGWRACFGVMSVLTLILIIWVLAKIPAFPGQATDKRLSLIQVAKIPGVRAVLFVVAAFVLAHNILYTYIAPFLVDVGLGERIDLVLLVFGVAALAGIWVTGVLIDHLLRELTLVSTVLFGLAAAALVFWSDSEAVVYISIGVWGLAFGGAATLFQTAIAKTSGDAADLAQSMLVTAWNASIAGGGVIGGLLLDAFGVRAFAPALIALLIPTLLVVWAARRYGFAPASKAHRSSISRTGAA